MTLRQSIRFALRWCGSAVWLIACWMVWLILAAGIGLQIWVITRRKLELPDFALRALERRLAASEVTARFGRAVFDPTGRVLIEQVQLFGPDQSVPLITIRAAYASIEFLPLLVGEVRVHEVRLTGVDLQIPAMLSPSGTDEAVVSDLDGVFRARGSDYQIVVCTFRIGGVAVTSHGRFHLPEEIGSRPGSIPLLDIVLDRCLKAGRKLVALRPRIEALEEPRLQLTFTPSRDAGALVEAELFVDSSHPDAPCAVQSGRAHTVFPLLGAAPAPTVVTIDAVRLAYKDQGMLARLHVALSGTLVPDRFLFTPQTVQLSAAGGSAMSLFFSAPAARFAVAEWPRIRGDAVLQSCGAPVEARADVEVRQGAGRVDLSASLTPDLLALAAAKSGLPAARRVSLGEPASLQARIDFAGGWRPVRAEGNVSLRRAIAQDVPIDAAGGHFTWAGHGLDITDLTLFQGENAAFGSYAMDTATNEYRFLLHGRLRPLDISGWFRDWWPRFWSSFEFAGAPPAADVDLAGRWGTARESVVFCHADADRTGIRGVPFDRVRATLFFRPEFFDVFDFNVERAGHAASGSFTLAVETDHSTYRSLDFDAVCDLDPAECARLYGPQGTALAAPFKFAEPPTVRLAGHFLGPAMPGGPHTQMHFSMAENSRLTVHGFPLDTVKFSADYHDGNLDLQDVEAGFAGGTATGRLQVAGLPEGRTLAFEAKLGGADLARVITVLDGFQSAGKPPGLRPLRRAVAAPRVGRPHGRPDFRLRPAGGAVQFPWQRPVHGHGPGARRDPPVRVALGDVEQDVAQLQLAAPRQRPG